MYKYLGKVLQFLDFGAGNSLTKKPICGDLSWGRYNFPQKIVEKNIDHHWKKSQLQYKSASFLANKFRSSNKKWSLKNIQQKFLLENPQSSFFEKLVGGFNPFEKY